MGKLTNTETRPATLKQPKTVALSTYIQGIIITALVMGLIGTVAGYFIATNMQSNARQSAVSDFQTVLKASK